MNATPAPSLDEAGAAWLADIEAQLDSTTIDQYGVYVASHWMTFFGTLQRLASSGAVAAYTNERLMRVRRKTVLKELSALRGFTAWCKARGLLTEVPRIDSPPRKATGKPDTRRHHKLRPVDLEDHEVEAVLAKLPEWVKTARAAKGYPVRARFEVAWEAGLRPATLDELRVSDYDRAKGTLRIRDEIDKARYGRELPLTSRARAALERVLPSDGVVFGRHDCRERLRIAAAEAALPPEKAARISPYDFRHARLSFWAERTTDLSGMAYLAGHKHVSTTDKYVRPRLRAAQEVLRLTERKEREP